MADGIITNVDTGSVLLGGNGVWHSETLLFAATDIFVEGTIFARKLVSDTIAVTPNGGNTGDHTITAAAQAGRTLKIGTYTLIAGTLSTGFGPWTLTDPDGIAEVYTTSAATEDMTFPNLGIDVTVTAVGVDFVTGDDADIVPAAQAGTPLVPFSPTGTGGEQNPLCVITTEYTRTGAGSLAVEALMDGKVDSNRLIIDEDGDGSNITEEILDQLRSAGIVTKPVTQLGAQDNQ